jgi:hypothetical protein
MISGGHLVAKVQLSVKRIFWSPLRNAVLMFTAVNVRLVDVVVPRALDVETH